MHIFLVGGKARSGKDSLSDIMMNRLDGKSIKIAMADYLKFIVFSHERDALIWV